MQIEMLQRQLAFAIRDRDFSKAQRLLCSSSSSSSKIKKERQEENKIDTQNLKAALHLKLNDPLRAASIFGKLLEENPHLSKNSAFLSNLAVIFSHLKDPARARITLCLIEDKTGGDDGEKRKEGNETDSQNWFGELSLASPPSSSIIDASSSSFSNSSLMKKQSRKKNGNSSSSSFREQEGEIIVRIKSEIASCLKSLGETGREEAEEEEETRTETKQQVMKRLFALRGVCRSRKWKKSKAVSCHLKQRVEKIITRSVLLL